MYTTNRRYLDRMRYSGSGRQNGEVLYSSYSAPRLVEGVYSWRTGKNAVSDLAESPPTRSVDSWGIITPKTSGGLGSRLADRKRYIEEVQRAAFPAETQSGSISTDRVSKTDSGHLFASHKTLRYPAVGLLRFNQGSSNNFDGLMTASVHNGLQNPTAQYAFGFPSESFINELGVSPAARQGMANRWFAATAPDRQVGTIGVTLIELLRGDVPSMLKNFRKMMDGAMSVKKALGSDYLNIVFGWTPLINEYANIIKVGMGLERAIYYESYRRKRAWEGPSLSTSNTYPTITLNTGGRVFGNQTIMEDGDIFTNSGYGVQFTTDSSKTVQEDYRFTSRYTGLARAGRKANSYSEQAIDTITKLGLIDDPTMLWDLTPYSWLVDWFATMGESIANASLYSPISGKYNVDFAYMTTKHTYVHKAHLLRPFGNVTGLSISVPTPTSYVSMVTKWRDRATPFGFGTQMGSLTAGQFAILVALGFAQSR